MFTEILQQIGLSLNEAKIYEALLDLKEAGVSEISSRTSIHRRNAQVLANLSGQVAVNIIMAWHGRSSF